MTGSEVPTAPGTAEERVRAEAMEVAKRVGEGTDGIRVPTELVEEPTEPRKALEPEKALWLRVREMSVAEKVKLALRGNKDARLILIRDTNKMIRRCVLQNPRIGDSEVVAIAGNRSSDDDSLRFIAEKREWAQNYEVRRALAVNPKTPLMLAMRFVGLLLERDLRQVSRSKNVPETIAAQARRLLHARHERK